MSTTLPKTFQIADFKVPQLVGTILPIKPAKLAQTARAITEVHDLSKPFALLCQDEKNAQVFVSMRRARADARLVGIRQKKKDEKDKEADAPAKAPKGAADAE